MNHAADTADTQSISFRIIEAISRERGVEPTELDPLYHSINPDALDALFEDSPGGPGRRGPRVTFRFGEYRVTASDDGSVSVTTDMESRPATGDERTTTAGDTTNQRTD